MTLKHFRKKSNHTIYSSYFTYHKGFDKNKSNTHDMYIGIVGSYIVMIRKTKGNFDNDVTKNMHVPIPRVLSCKSVINVAKRNEILL